MCSLFTTQCVPRPMHFWCFNLPHECFVLWRSLLHFVVRSNMSHCTAFFFFACPMHSLYKILCVPSCSTGEFLPVLPMYLLCSVIVLLPIISCVLKSDTCAYHHAFLYPDPPSPAEFFIRFTMRPLQASQRVR